MEQPDSETSNATILLSRAARGDAAASKSMTTLTYDRLRELARGYLRSERPDHTLQPTALVHEAFVRLFDQSGVDWNDRSFFLGVAAREMRRILIDHARRHQRVKRGAQWVRVALEDLAIPIEEEKVELLDIDQTLTDLAEIHARQARLVELRFFAGLSVAEAATVLGISAKTAEKDWTVARAWLYRGLRRGFAS